MAQTSSGQAKAQSRIAKSEMASKKANDTQKGKVAPKLSPNVSVGATSHNTPALRRNKIIQNVKGSSPASVAGLGI